MVIGSSVASIGNAAFSGCAALRSIYIPKNVVSMPANAYAYNSPFYSACEELLIVLENDTQGDFGRYFANITDEKKAITVSKF